MVVARAPRKELLGGPEVGLGAMRGLVERPWLVCVNDLPDICGPVNDGKLECKLLRRGEEMRLLATLPAEVAVFTVASTNGGIVCCRRPTGYLNREST